MERRAVIDQDGRRGVVKMKYKLDNIKGKGCTHISGIFDERKDLNMAYTQLQYYKDNEHNDICGYKVELRIGND